MDSLSNGVEVSNEGIEFEVTCDILRETKVTWRSKITASRNWNRFEKSYSGKDEDSFIIGKPLFNIYLYKDNGYYNSQDEVPVYYQADGSKKYLMPMFEHNILRQEILKLWMSMVMVK